MCVLTTTPRGLVESTRSPILRDHGSSKASSRTPPSSARASPTCLSNCASEAVGRLERVPAAALQVQGRGANRHRDPTGHSRHELREVAERERLLVRLPGRPCPSARARAARRVVAISRSNSCSIDVPMLIRVCSWNAVPVDVRLRGNKPTAVAVSLKARRRIGDRTVPFARRVRGLTSRGQTSAGDTPCPNHGTRPVRGRGAK